MQKLISEILAAWREAERVALGAAGEEADLARIAAARLRDLYQELHVRRGRRDETDLRAALEEYRVHPAG